MRSSENKNLPYLIAVTIMAIIAVIGIVIVAIVHPADSMLIIGAIIGFLTPTTLSLLAFMKSQETHQAVNGRLGQFIENSNALAASQGFAAGVAQNKADALSKSK